MTRRYVPRTKIVCTLGPASSSETVIRKMVRNGMDVVRLNFSHGNRAGHESKLQTVRRINRKYRRAVQVLGDLEGPRVRLGYFGSHRPVLLEKNRRVDLVQSGPAEPKRLLIDYEAPLTDFEGAAFLYIDDGNIVLRVRRALAERVETRVVVGGVLKERKAVNAPGADLVFPAITEKDERDIEFAVESRVDCLAQSFVRGPGDVHEVRRRLESRLPGCRVIAKIENRDGIRNINDIIAAADGIMIARGDMGVCVPIHEVPFIQKGIIRKCNRAGKMVITATQMLEHMVEYPTPTRAEVTDVANAVLDGTDCVMLSAETAVGRYPVEAVRTMNEIVKYAERRAPPP